MPLWRKNVESDHEIRRFINGNGIDSTKKKVKWTKCLNYVYCFAHNYCYRPRYIKGKNDLKRTACAENFKPSAFLIPDHSKLSNDQT